MGHFTAAAGRAASLASLEKVLAFVPRPAPVWSGPFLLCIDAAAGALGRLVWGLSCLASFISSCCPKLLLEAAIRVP